MRVVLDTNVLLSGMAVRGLCEALLDLLFDSPSHKVVLSEHILTEFRRQYREKFGMTAEETDLAESFLRANCELAVPNDVPPDACRDPDDLPILGTLVAGEADCLATGDADLLALGRYEGSCILSPRQCYDILR